MLHSIYRDGRPQGWKWLQHPPRYKIAKPKIAEYTFNCLFKVGFDFSALNYPLGAKDLVIFSVPSAVLKKKKHLFL